MVGSSFFIAVHFYRMQIWKFAFFSGCFMLSPRFPANLFFRWWGQGRSFSDFAAGTLPAPDWTPAWDRALPGSLCILRLVFTCPRFSSVPRIFFVCVLRLCLLFVWLGMQLIDTRTEQ
jgi:hypothetical protein